MKEYTLDFLTTTAIKYGTRIFWTAVIVFVGLRVIRMVRTAAGQIMDRAGVEITLKKFLDMLLHVVLFGVMVFMAADQLGIKTTSFVAVIGTVTLAFSLAMQNTLSNFAGGTLILLLKPFKVGDNMGILKTTENEMQASFSIRSSVSSEKFMLMDMISCLMDSLGGYITNFGEYPAWEFKKESHLRDVMSEVFDLYKLLEDIFHELP